MLDRVGTYELVFKVLHGLASYELNQALELVVIKITPTGRQHTAVVLLAT